MLKSWAIANLHNYSAGFRGPSWCRWDVFLCELFLQRLPANVRMILTSTADTVSMENVVELADTGCCTMPLVCPSLSKQLRRFSRWSSSPAHVCTPTDCMLCCWYHQKYGAEKCTPPYDKEMTQEVTGESSILWYWSLRFLSILVQKCHTSLTYRQNNQQHPYSDSQHPLSQGVGSVTGPSPSLWHPICTV